MLLTEDKTTRLRRILGVGFNLAVVVGGTLGIGILRAPGPVAAQFQQPAIILMIWIAGGLYAVLGATCLIELGAMTPHAGGYYIHARRAFGDRVGFAVGWMDWVAYCAVIGYVAIGMAELLCVLVPVLAGAVRPVAIALLTGFAALQWTGLRLSSWFQQWTTALKCLAFFALVVAGLIVSGAHDNAALPTARPGLVGALELVMITYGGWHSAMYFTEEDRNPGRNLPRAMIGGVIAVIVIYVLVNVALLAILPLAVLATAILPAADAAQAIAGPRGGQIITVLSIISLPPLLNATVMIGTRILFALGRDRLLWPGTADVDAGGTPRIAMLITTAVAVVLTATGTFQRLGSVAAWFLAVNFSVGCVALPTLRRREPEAPRPFRAWGYPRSTAVVVCGAIAFAVHVVVADTVTATMATGLLALGFVVHAARGRMVARTGAR
ncbi:MAG TPA: APC family permease [Kofleriaceae bacterium]